MTLRGKHLTPSVARLMFAAAARDDLREGNFDFTVPAQGGGRLKAGRIIYKKA